MHVEIPTFLRRSKDNSVPRVKPPKGSPKPAPRQTPVPPADPLRDLSPPARGLVNELVSRGQYRLHWLEDPAAVNQVERMVDISIAAAGESRLRFEEFKRNRPVKVSPYQGLVPLADIIEEMGDVVPGSSASNIRAHAANAIEAAKLVHQKRHFDPALVPRVKEVLAVKFKTVREKRKE